MSKTERLLTDEEMRSKVYNDYGRYLLTLQLEDVINLLKVQTSLAFAAGEQAQKEKDRQEIEKVNRVSAGLVKDLNNMGQALSEAEKKGARNLIVEIKNNNCIGTVTGKQNHLGLMLTAEYWQSKLKEIESK